MLGLFPSKAGKRENQQGITRHGIRSQDAYAQLQDLIGQLAEQSQGAYAEGDQTVDQRFGDVLQSINQNINAQGAATRSNISRSNMATGGDISGSAGVGMAKTNQDTNRAIQNAFNYYSQANIGANQRANRRGDQLTSRGASINQNQYTFDTGNRQGYERREIQRRQASRQTLGDLIGSGLGLAGQVLSPAIASIFEGNDNEEEEG